MIQIAKKRILELECILEDEGFLLGKYYKKIGGSGRYLEMIDENGIAQITSEIYFKVSTKSKKGSDNN